MSSFNAEMSIREELRARMIAQEKHHQENTILLLPKGTKIPAGGYSGQIIPPLPQELQFGDPGKFESHALVIINHHTETGDYFSIKAHAFRTCISNPTEEEIKTVQEMLTSLLVKANIGRKVMDVSLSELPKTVMTVEEVSNV